MFRGKEIQKYYVIIKVKAETEETAWRFKEILNFPEVISVQVYEAGELSLDEKGKLGIQLIPVQEPDKKS